MPKKDSPADRERLRPLIEEATVDCYNESEEHQGFVTMLEENVACPFPAKVIGEAVEVTALRAPRGMGILTVCRYKGKDYAIDLTSLEWTKQRPDGFEWIEAYLEWLKSVG
jgi:hypothetical protein